MHALVAARDADGHRLGLVLDRIDRPGELLDGPRERADEVVEQRRRRADLAGLPLVGLDGMVRQHVAEQRRRGARRCSPRGGRRSGRCAGRRRTARRRGRCRPRTGRSIGVGADRRRATARSMTSRASRSGIGRGVDGEGGLVAEEVARPSSRARTPAPGRSAARRSCATPRSTGRRPRRRRRSASPCGPEDRHLLGDVVGGRPDSPAAHTRISGSDDRSMCFLSSVTSQAIDL